MDRLTESADLACGVSKRLIRHFKAQVEDWYDVCRNLSAWEDRHLIDQPTAERLEEHACYLDELEQAGRWLAMATQSPDFPDRTTAELVAMTLQHIKDRRSLWHGSISRDQRKEIMHAIFNES